jgi:hypothetical protein
MVLGHCSNDYREISLRITFPLTQCLTWKEYKSVPTLSQNMAQVLYDFLSPRSIIHRYENTWTRNSLISMAIKKLFLCHTGIYSTSIVTPINSVFYYGWTLYCLCALWWTSNNDMWWFSAADDSYTLYVLKSCRLTTVVWCNSTVACNLFIVIFATTDYFFYFILLLYTKIIGKLYYRVK